jgi:hypothetical protein
LSFTPEIELKKKKLEKIYSGIHIRWKRHEIKLTFQLIALPAQILGDYTNRILHWCPSIKFNCLCENLRALMITSHLES